MANPDSVCAPLLPRASSVFYKLTGDTFGGLRCSDTPRGRFVPSPPLEESLGLVTFVGSLSTSPPPLSELTQRRIIFITLYTPAIARRTVRRRICPSLSLNTQTADTNNRPGRPRVEWRGRRRDSLFLLRAVWVRTNHPHSFHIVHWCTSIIVGMYFVKSTLLYCHNSSVP